MHGKFSYNEYMKFRAVRFCTILLILSALPLFLFANNLRDDSFIQFETLYFSNFAKAMSVCYSENFVRKGIEIENGNITRFIELKNHTSSAQKKKTQKFFYISGRLIPGENLRNLKFDWKDYAPIYAESYSSKIVEPKDMSPLQKKLIVELGRTENRRNNKPNTFTLVQNFIYNAETQRQIEQELGRITFLGERISVHYKIKPALSRVQAKLDKAALTDWQVRRFLERPHTISAYNWREIRDSYQRSAHSWGLSIDYMEAEEIRGSKQIYWRWAKGFYDDDWVNIGTKKRWHPGDSVIAIFESEGFVWGGKWELWDNMHFEYRPEVIYMMQN